MKAARKLAAFFYGFHPSPPAANGFVRHRLHTRWRSSRRRTPAPPRSAFPQTSTEMLKLFSMTLRVFLFVVLFALFVFSADKPAEVKGGNGITLPPPPPTQEKPVTEDIHGTSITDPYRWLEDQDSPETRAWIGEQMKYTEQYLSQVKVRPAMVDELTKLERVESYTIPAERAGNYFFKKRLADENQGSIYLRRGLHGQDERLIDATKLSADQNTSVQINDVSKDGKLLVYGTRSGGADEETVHILDVAAGKDLADSLPSARYDGVQLSPDGKSLFYARFDPTGSLVFQHKLGEDASKDELIFGKEFE